MEIHQAVKALLEIVDSLHTRYPQKPFTLDGRLVGDLGEILVEQDYEVKLFKRIEKHHDGVTPDGKKVQIKTTMKNSLTVKLHSKLIQKPHIFALNFDPCMITLRPALTRSSWVSY
ncbi:MAG: hypothetical protein JKY51_05615 [Opitutaceae bacterium]|nr:hypothetical protein [Opitutaceae bacterium]